MHNSARTLPNQNNFNLMTYTSAYTLVAISIDKYVAIVYPMRLRMTKKQAKIIILVIWLAALITSLPIAILSQLENEINPANAAARSHQTSNQNATSMNPSLHLPQTQTTPTPNTNQRILGADVNFNETSQSHSATVSTPHIIIKSHHPSPLKGSNLDSHHHHNLVAHKASQPQQTTTTSRFDYNDNNHEAQFEDAKRTDEEISSLINSVSTTNQPYHQPAESSMIDQVSKVSVGNPNFVSQKSSHQQSESQSGKSTMTTTPAFIPTQTQSYETEKLYCHENWSFWPQGRYYYSTTLMILQFVIPLFVLIITYSRIVIIVWGKKMPGEEDDARDARMARSKRKVNI